MEKELNLWLTWVIFFLRLLSIALKASLTALSPKFQGRPGYRLATWEIFWLEEPLDQKKDAGR
jgi:hypothetical protein